MPQGSVINTTVLLGKLIEHNISTGAYKKYYLFNGKLLALREGLGSGSTYRYLVTDHPSTSSGQALGSLNTTLNLDGTVYSDLRYTPFGKERWAINTSPTGARFTAQRLDDLLALYNYNARYYDPAIGRFISADSIVPYPNNPQSFNRFTYVYNNPVMYTDPTGHRGSSTLHNFVVIYFASFILPRTIPHLRMEGHQPDLVYSLIVKHETVVNYVWEVKPVSNFSNQEYRANALAQRDRYIKALPKGVAGPTIETLTGKPTYTIPFHPYDPENMVVDIFSGGIPGMIFYNERKKTKKERNLPQEDLVAAYTPTAQAIILQNQELELPQNAIPEENEVPSPVRPIPYTDFQDDLLILLTVAGVLQISLGGGSNEFAIAY